MNDSRLMHSKAVAAWICWRTAGRRREAEEAARRNPPATEYGGRDGLDPARYGDWEKKGLAIDF